jgi:methylated-DNA-[protein]-cysteine S-methyltransferase
MRNAGSMLMSEAAGYCLFDTAIGACGLAWSGRGVTTLQLPGADRERTERRLRQQRPEAKATEPTPAARTAIAAITRYLAGERVDLTGIELDLAGIDPLRKRIYTAARSIGWGEVASYGEIAQRAGCPGEAREVGQAMARNPVAIVIPCHRVLAKGMKIGGFSAHGGVLTKQRLLALEGVSLGDDAPLLPGLLPEPRHR